MAHMHEVVDTDLYFSIDADTKEITFEGEVDPVLVQGDHDSERFTFTLPRFIDGHDMSICDIAQVHFVNMNEENHAERSIDIYDITDLQPDEENPSFLLCTWLVSGVATKYTGPLNFALRFACTTNGRVEYAWYTRPYTKIGVSKTIDNTVPFAEYYSDILLKWYDELVVAGDTGVNLVIDAKDKAIEDMQAAIDAATANAIERIDAVETIRQIEDETLTAFETAEQVALNNIQKEREAAVQSMQNVMDESLKAIKNAEIDAITSGKDKLIAEIVNHILFNGSVEYPAAEGVSF